MKNPMITASVPNVLAIKPKYHLNQFF
jgi:hypothetical protein